MFDLCAERTALSVKRGPNREPITSGSANVCPVRFEFSADWDGLEKTAIFRAGTESRAAPLDETGACIVPWEVLQAPGYHLFAGVCGRRGESVVLPTVWTSLGLIQEGALPQSPGSDTHSPPTSESVSDHRLLSHRDAEKQHPIGAIDGLSAELERIPAPVEALTNEELEEMLK